jgi:hypothetical protein
MGLRVGQAQVKKLSRCLSSFNLLQWRFDPGAPKKGSERIGRGERI